MRALVLDAGSPAGVETIQALGRARVEVDAADTTPTSLAFRSRYPRRRLREPSPARPQEFLDWLEELDATRAYTLVVPATEGSLLAVRWLPARDPLRTKAVLPSDEALDTALDKRRTLELAARLGIPVPESRLITAAEAAAPAEEFPLVLKPVRSTVSVGGDVVILSAAIVRDEGGRLAALAERLPYGPVQEQRWVGGHGVGVELLYERGRLVWYFAHERIHEVPLTGGGSSYRRAVRPPADLLAAAQALLGALDWHGVAMVEFRVESDGSFSLMEVNPRLWGSLALPIDAGVNFPLGLWRIAAGLPHPPQPTYRERYFTRHLPKDLDWLRANWRADHGDPLLLTRPRVASLLELGRPLAGRESWDHWDVRDLGVTWAQLARLVAAHARTLMTRLRRRLLVRRIVRRHARRFARPTAVRRVLFVCHGNICRSAFAERLAEGRWNGCAVESAGVRATWNSPSPARLVRIARTMGVDLGDWRATRLGAVQVARADLILAMDPDTYERVVVEFPHAEAKTTVLGLYAREPRVVIPDPYAMTEVQMRRVIEQVKEAVEGLSEWLGGAATGGAGAGSTGAPSREVAMVGTEGDRRCAE